MSFEIRILRSIFSYTDMDTLVLTCRPASLMCQTVSEEEIGRRIEGTIGWFAQDVPRMQETMRRYSVFIAGSLALQLFSPVHFLASNADLYVDQKGYLAVIQHLTAMERYTVRSVQTVSPHIIAPRDPYADETVSAYGAGVSYIATLRRGDRVVHVLCTASPKPGSTLPCLDTITLSWTTMLFNYVTADYASCAYPRMTLMGRGLFHMERFLTGMPGTSSDHMLNTYAERGFEFARHPSWWLPGPDYTCTRGWCCPFETRRFGDGGGLTVPATLGPMTEVGRRWRFGGVSKSIHDE